MSARSRGVPRRLVSVLALAALLALVASTVAARAGSPTLRSRTAGVCIAERPLVTGEEDASASGDELLQALEQYAAAKTPPAESVPGAAYQAAVARAASMPVVGGAWDEVTDLPHESESAAYADPVFSNAGSGNGLAGRTGPGARDRRPDDLRRGGRRRPVALERPWRLVDADVRRPVDDVERRARRRSGHARRLVRHRRGEHGLRQLLGSGIYRSADRGQTWRRIGGRQLDGTLVSALAFDGRGRVLAATSRGVFARRSSGPARDRWTLVLAPGKAEPYGFRFANDVQVRPGTNGREVVATLGWRSGPTDYNGFYVSRRGGDRGTWHAVRTHGKLRSSRIARASFAYSADGTRLYALVESWQNLNSTPSALEGVFVSRSGDLEGPWSKRAGWRTLQQVDSGLEVYGTSYAPGVQA